MTALNASTVPVAVRIRNARYDGMLTGYLHGAPKFTKTDPGGFKAALFVVSQRLGFRSDMIQPYSRVYFYNKRNGDCIFEGDVTHPGRSAGADGELLEVTVDGGVERLNDWSGSRIFVDRDMEAWPKKDKESVTSGIVEASESRGGTGEDALTLAFPGDVHLEENYKIEAAYTRIFEAGQELGWLNFAWDAGITHGNWRIRLVTGTLSYQVARDIAANLSGGPSSGAVVGGSIPTGNTQAYLQFLWNNVNPSNTGTGDLTWVSFLRVIAMCRLKNKDGTFMAAVNYNDYVTATKVVNDLLGTVLIEGFDGANAVIDPGTSYNIRHMAYPDGVTPMQVLDDLMKSFEPSCTYIVGPSTPGVDKYSFKWITRPNVVRYEFIVWTDDYSGGTQAVDQFNEVATRWRTLAGASRVTVATQLIPEMTAAGRTRRFFQDLGAHPDQDDADQANATILAGHRYPKNGGRVRVQRAVVDLFTGRRVQPFEIEPGYLCRIVGVDPSVDALNATTANGSTVCRIISTDYSADADAADLDLDSPPLSMFRAIAATKNATTPKR